MFDRTTTTAISIENISITDGSVVKDEPAALAEIILKDIFYRARHNHISACIEPILTYVERRTLTYLFSFMFCSHLDDHDKWIPVDFPKYIFSVIINSIQVEKIKLIVLLRKSYSSCQILSLAS